MEKSQVIKAKLTSHIRESCTEKAPLNSSEESSCDSIRYSGILCLSLGRNQQLEKAIAAQISYKTVLFSFFLLPLPCILPEILNLEGMSRKRVKEKTPGPRVSDQGLADSGDYKLIITLKTGLKFITYLNFYT